MLGPAWEGNDPYDVSKKRVVAMRNDDILARLRKDKEIGQVFSLFFFFFSKSNPFSFPFGIIESFLGKDSKAIRNGS